MIGSRTYLCTAANPMPAEAIDARMDQHWSHPAATIVFPDTFDIERFKPKWMKSPQREYERAYSEFKCIHCHCIFKVFHDGE